MVGMVPLLVVEMIVMMIRSSGFLTRPDIATNENDPTICYRDNDLDGYGDILATGGIPAGTDCDDGDSGKTQI